MSAVLLDTHAWVWSFLAAARLSDPARGSLAAASQVLVSPISFFEIAQKVRLGKWPEIAPWLPELPAILDRQGGRAAPLSPAICARAGAMEWQHRDPFDRLIAATALTEKLPLISADAAFDQILTRVW